MHCVSIKLGLMAVSFVVSGMLYAAEFELKSALSNTSFDWSDPASYTGTHSNGPSTEDIIYIPAGMTAKVTAGSANWTVVNGVSRIVPRDGAVFEVEVPSDHEGSAFLNVPVTEYSASGATNTGRLRKTGGGILELASYGKLTGGNYDYYLDVNVGAGHLYFSKSGKTASERFMFRNISVEEGATLHVCLTGYTECENLDGEGFVTLDNTT